MAAFRNDRGMEIWNGVRDYHDNLFDNRWWGACGWWPGSLAGTLYRWLLESLGNNTDSVIEAGAYNLTQDVANCRVEFAKGKPMPWPGPPHSKRAKAHNGAKHVLCLDRCKVACFRIAQPTPFRG